MTIKCELFPEMENIQNYMNFEIIDKNVTDYTHIMHKYPSKYIPQIPKWAILNFSNEGDIVLDPFSGSGTTSTESIVNGRNTIGIDINPVAALISKVKTTPINPEMLKAEYENLIARAQSHNSRKDEVVPDIPRINHWFKDVSIDNLSKLKFEILRIENQDIKDFFLVNFSAIIRKASNAEYRSQKTYVSSRFQKDPADVFQIFEKRFNQYLEGMKKLYREASQQGSTAEIIVSTADDFSLSEFNSVPTETQIDLAITSPPYVTAVEYPAVFKLEYQWLDYFEDREINEHRKNYIGTDRCYKNQYDVLQSLGYENLDQQLSEIFELNRKKSYIVYDYFRRMENNIQKVYESLKTGGKYVIVVGNNSVMNLEIPIRDYLIEIGENNGFTMKKVFSYLIKDKHVPFLTNGEGCMINYDWIIVLEK